MTRRTPHTAFHPHILRSLSSVSFHIGQNLTPASKLCTVNAKSKG